ncbi:hypothetical protein IHE44_0014698 [Lamprotornis superbus]|uniref:Uncharacterized protein n=1 Tax=Lamprotornis superbus TaxID=245042 RepID=A0A835ND04_9PASS|nr:hypothetical protein IHE44_0014698 [Lamprotornis superbus]
MGASGIQPRGGEIYGPFEWHPAKRWGDLRAIVRCSETEHALVLQEAAVGIVPVQRHCTMDSTASTERQQTITQQACTLTRPELLSRSRWEVLGVASILVTVGPVARTGMLPAEILYGAEFLPDQSCHLCGLWLILCRISPRPKLSPPRTVADIGAPKASSKLTSGNWDGEICFPRNRGSIDYLGPLAQAGLLPTKIPHSTGLLPDQNYHYLEAWVPLECQTPPPN